MGNNFVKAMREASYSHFNNNLCHVKDSSFRFTPFGMTPYLFFREERRRRPAKVKAGRLRLSPLYLDQPVIPNEVRNLYVYPSTSKKDLAQIKL